MAHKTNVVAMLLAGGQGSRLGVLTKNIAKPAVPYGGNYRIIDFPLSNCVNSGIYTVGVLTQYQPLELNDYLGNGQPWDLDRQNGGVHILSPYEAIGGAEWYKGTANAIYQNINFIEKYDPEYVVVLSGDHIYKMNYAKMIDFHKKHNADCTIAVLEVPWEEASRFGIITADGTGRITKFTEKPKQPDSNLASMGIYIFSTDLLVRALKEDAVDQTSEHDFGKNVIPKLLGEGKRLFTYEFNGFWRDVGTISSYHETSMDLLGPNPDFDIYSKEFPIMSNSSMRPPAYVGKDGNIDDCLVSNGCKILGRAKHSILSTDCYIGERATVEDSVLLPGARVKAGAHVVRAILGENSVVEENVNLGSVDTTKDTAVIGNDVVVGRGEN